jgi:hypothetical protein
VSRNFIANAGTYLTADEIGRLRRKSDVVGALLVLHAWAVIVGAWALFVLWPNPLTFLAAVMIVGGRQLGVAILMHDAAHGLLFRNRRVNDWVGEWLCAYPVGADMALYRPYHLTHHRLTQQPDDPDLTLSAPFPITRASLRRKLVRDLTGRTAYQRRRLQLAHDAREPAGAPAGRAVLREPSPRAPSVPVRALLAPARGAPPAGRQGARAAHGAAAGLRGRARDRRVRVRRSPSRSRARGPALVVDQRAPIRMNAAQ